MALRELSSLLEAGLPTARAVEQLKPVFAELPQDERDALQRRIDYSIELGLPLVETLSGMAVRAEQRTELAREIESAFAAPKATARLMLWLPLLSLGVAQLAGLRPLETLAGNGLAQASLGAGGLLLAIGWFAMKRMVEKRQPNDIDDAELFDLFADTLRSGLSTKECFELAATHSVSVASTWQFAEAKRLIDFAFVNGVRLRSLLLATASAHRASQRAQQITAIERLSVQLMIPLGLVVLPAFVLIGVLPVAIGMMSRG
ncbi:MAG: hypothetical protein RLZ88_64 [Actinomycetota bacterium]|jgi:tight adherence protein B